MKVLLIQFPLFEPDSVSLTQGNRQTIKVERIGCDGVSLAPYYQACVRLVRADYCGDGVGYTRNGTPIDVFDAIGIQRDEIAPGMTFEAAWGPDGAVCVRHPRLEELPNPETLVQQCPRLAGYVGERCDEAARALLFNRSFEH
ncbi:MAG: hypothetical protein JOY83_22635 [Alphaproteobacteria bacterium]|nr:hypothetical protein [Alphaproteobacteria bacterium]